MLESNFYKTFMEDTGFLCEMEAKEIPHVYENKIKKVLTNSCPIKNNKIMLMSYIRFLDM